MLRIRTILFRPRQLSDEGGRRSMRITIYSLCVLCALVLYPVAQASAEDHTVILLRRADRMVCDMDPVSGKVINQVQLAGVPTDAVFSWDEKWLFVSVPDQGYIA